MKLEALTLAQCEQVRTWRNTRMETLRTPFPLTEPMQEWFFRGVVCNRDAPHRYWAIMDGDAFLGMGGMTCISWYNRTAEASMFISPKHQGEGLGEEAFGLLLDEAFGRMGLRTVTLECYACNSSGIAFWRKNKTRYNAYETLLPNRKFWDGEFWDSLYFSIDVDDWRKVAHDDPE